MTFEYMNLGFLEVDYYGVISTDKSNIWVAFYFVNVVLVNERYACVMLIPSLRIECLRDLYLSRPSINII